MHISQKSFSINTDEKNHFKPWQFHPGGKMHLTYSKVMTEERRRMESDDGDEQVTGTR